ncbi:molybdate ABC transporter substrate-binding protein [Dendronalium sp. ChiSLP03b]|uniref:molybdate ABC transporter substrate-binding protein n=1 Tax=Dendronalium sp. ChiSLP03b TaxID=3075381 RepID=UPI002AD50F67|nr:molybdate ABC transporter substrate-binding protein [Dendronalium sp. ChiSLP03b]MDZ8206549.1 molybdate ABC transporter substrate-binding protein [Dendronalium sp. ChiSLP03b]
MKKYLIAILLTTSTFSLILSHPAFAVTLYGAGSLRNSLTEVANSFTQEYKISVTTRFGPSGLTRELIEQELSQTGKSADVFASADINNPLTLFQQGLSEPVETFASNRLVVVARSRLSLRSDNLLSKLLDPQIRVGTSTPLADPLGDYTQQVFRKADQINPGSFQQLNQKALRLSGGANSPLVPAGRVNLVYFLEDTQQVDIYLSYYTIALSALKQSSNLQVVELPENLAVKVDYGLTVLKDASPEGTKLADYILSPIGQKILTNYGFTAARTTSIPESQGVVGIVLAIGVAFAIQKKLASTKKQRLDSKNPSIQ